MLKLAIALPGLILSSYYVWTVVHGLMYYTSTLLLATTTINH